MKKILSVLSVIMAVSMFTNAQSVDLGIKGGLTIPNLSSGGEVTPLSDNYSSILSGGGGVFVDVHFSHLFSLTTGLEYSRQGGQKDGVQALPAAPIYTNAIAANPSFAGLTPFMPKDYLYADFKSEPQFDYLMLPVQARFGWNFTKTSPFRVYVSAGIFGSYLMDARRISKGESQFYADENATALKQYATANYGNILNVMDPMQSAMILGGIDAFGKNVNDLNQTENITNDIHRFNFGFIGNVGISYRFATKNSIFIEGGGNYGLLNIQKDTANGQNRIGAANVMIGYSYLL